MTARVWRADLARVLLDLPESRVDGVAARLGFARVEPQVAASTAVSHGDGATTIDAPSSGVAETHATPEAPQDLFELWRLESSTVTAKPVDPVVLPAPEVAPLTEEDLDADDTPVVPLLRQQPLRPWSQLWPTLQSALRVMAPGRALDVATIVRRWSRGQRVGRLPRTSRGVWPSALHLWIDRGDRLTPFWADQDDVGRRVARMCGPDRVQVEVVDARRVESLAAQVARGVDANTPVLVLGDLGFYVGEVSTTAWQRAGRRLRASGATVAALVPCPPVRWNAGAARAWRAMTWEHARASEGLAARAREGGEGFWAARAERLLTQVSPATVLQPGLLRALRQLLPAREVDASTEVDVWRHPAVRAASMSGLTLRPEAQRTLRTRFAEELRNDPQRARRTAHTLTLWHEMLPRELLHMETLAWHAVVAPEVSAPPGNLWEAQRFVLRLDAAVDRADPEWYSALRRYGQTHLAGVPHAIYDKLPWMKNVWKAAFEGAHGVPVPPNIDPSRLPSRRPGVVPPKATHFAWRLIGDTLVAQVVEDGRWASHVEGGGCPVGTLRVRGRDVSVVYGGGDRTQVRVGEGTRVPLRDGEWVELRGDHGVLRVAPWAMEPWMSACGCDPYGVWCAFEVGGVTARMRWIPAGRFVMGSSPWTTALRNDKERPQHEVTLTRGYWLGETPVTQALWRVVMGKNPSRFVSDDRPVEQVSWLECEGFIARVNTTVTGLSARFPTEAEWEYACRAGTTAATWAGDLKIFGAYYAPSLDAVAWYGGNCGVDFELKNGEDRTEWPEKQYDHRFGGTHPVARKPPNPLGLHDMLGNVDEWCGDWLGEYDEVSVVNPTGPSSGALRVFRGGSWGSGARDVGAANRIGRPPELRYDGVGFRLARGQGLRSSGGAGVARSDTQAPEIQKPSRPTKRPR